EIKMLVKDAEENAMICNIFFNYDQFYKNLIPLKSNDRLFLSANEDDFILDGYTIRHFKDVFKVKIKRDMCDQILKKEGWTNNLKTPDVDITGWKTVFESLKRINKNIIIEKETPEEKNDEFVIGRIEKIYKNFAYVWNFDADGIWSNSPIQVPYSEITSVTFFSRYVDIFSKYISEPPFLLNDRI
ncbi:MAG: hypothetical protein WA125_08005, partial [Desulfosporosinus sp.]